MTDSHALQQKNSSGKPLEVLVLAHVPTGYYHCTHCEVAWQEVGLGQEVHREQMRSSVPDDLLQECHRLSAWARDVARRYSDQVVVRVVDPVSIEGFITSLRYGARQYPSFIIGGREKVSGPDYRRVDQVLAERLGPGA